MSPIEHVLPNGTTAMEKARDSAQDRPAVSRQAIVGGDRRPLVTSTGPQYRASQTLTAVLRDATRVHRPDLRLNLRHTAPLALAIIGPHPHVPHLT